MARIRTIKPEFPQSAVVVRPNSEKRYEFCCDSPIEAKMAGVLFENLRVHGLMISTQHRLGPFRYDLALTLPGKSHPSILIECDGKDFHSTPAQKANDRRKEAVARICGVQVIRLKGTDIHNRPSRCLHVVLSKLEPLLKAAGVQ